MALEPITRQEKIISGENLKPITRMEMFLKEFGGGGSGGSGGGVSSWNDLTDKPFFEEKTELIAETSIETAQSTMLPHFLYVAELPTAVDFTEGQTYEVVFNGESYISVCDNGLVGNKAIFGEGEDTGEPFMLLVAEEPNFLITLSEMHANVAVYEYNIKRVDKKFVPSEIPVYGTLGDVVSITWDGNTDGLEYLDYDIFKYYKISDTVIPPDHIVRAFGKRSDGTGYDGIGRGTNCYLVGAVIVVMTAGHCESDEGIAFDAPSPGVYLFHHWFGEELVWADFTEIDTRRENAILYLNNPSGVKYAITVDDNGTLTATAI